MIGPAGAERDFRRPGCGDGCRVLACLIPGTFGRSEVLLHDPDDHEAYGRRSVVGAEDAPPVETGGLVVDLGNATVLVDGRAVAPTPTEARLLFVLARRVGRLASHAELALGAWGLAVFEAPDASYRHALRVNMTRLRKRIHPLGGLISTVPTFGYRLEALAAGAPPPDAGANYFLRTADWALRWEACRACGLTDLPHEAYGYCSSCYGTRSVRPRRGVGAAIHARAAQAASRAMELP
jgi:DNA-binding winged helix-turn-helix (wHTH) protein